MSSRALVLLATVAAGLACHPASPASPEPEPEPEPGSAPAPDPALAEAALAFQRDYDRSLREDELSFLTAIAAHYLAAGQQLVLTPGETGWVPGESAELPGALELTATAEALILERDGERREMRTRQTLPLDEAGRWKLVVSRQEQDFRVLVHDREAPLRREFPGVVWFPVDPAFIVAARYEPIDERSATVLQTSRGETKTLYEAGVLRFELGGASHELVAFTYEPDFVAGEPLLIPFRDLTTGRESYGAGRYLELDSPAPGEPLRLDFNRATNPLCAYSEHYNCPLPPSFNRLELEIRAGARAH